MAKFVKPIVVAASVAAVVGIGAVSFAAWKGDKLPSDQEGTSAIYTAGELKVAEENITTKKIMPIDQEGVLTTDTGNVKMWTVKLTTENLGDNYKNISVKHNHSFQAPDGGTAGNFYFLAKNEDTATVTVPSKADLTASGTEWQAMTGTVKLFNTTDDVITESALDTYFVYIVMVSDNTADASAPGTPDPTLVTTKFTFELVK